MTHAANWKLLNKIRHLAHQIQDELAGADPRSMCQLRFTYGCERADDYYEFLYDKVLVKLTPADLWTGNWCIGSLLLLLITETARRNATGHSLWSCIAEWLPEHLHWELFDDDQPTPLLRELIRAAADNVNIRHAFGDARIRQPYYVTVHLQFGLTRSAIESRLSGWLRGENPPIALRKLLSGPLASQSFRKLWDALKGFYYQTISQDEFRDLIAGSPWVLPEWHDLFVQVLRDGRAVGRFRERASDEDDRRFLQPAVGVWDPLHGPYFTCGWSASTTVLSDTEFPYLDLHVGDTVAGRVVRQEDGTFRLHETAIRLSADTSPQVVTLVAPHGVTVASQVVHLWTEDEDIAVFQVRRRGQLVPVRSSLSVKQPCLIWAPADYRVVPHPNAWFRGGSAEQPWIASYFDAGWDADELRVETPQGQTVWRASRSAEEITLNDRVADQIRVSVFGGRLVTIGDRTSLVVQGVPPNGRIISARLNGRSVPVDGTLLSDITVSPSDAGRGFDVQLGIALEKETVHVRRRCSIPLMGAVYRQGDDWLACNPERTISVARCRSQMFRIFCGDVEQSVITEGSRFVRAVGKRAHALAGVVGTGAPLAVRRDRLNAPEELLRIAAGVVEQGIVEHVTCTPVGWRVTLTAPVHPEPDHALVCWPCRNGDRPTIVPAEQLAALADGAVWTAQCPRCNGEVPTIVAIRFRQTWMGGALHGQWKDLFARLTEIPMEPSQIARWARWLRLPVLLSSRSDTPVFSAFAHQYPAEVLQAWIGPAADPASPHANGRLDDARSSLAGEVIRGLFVEWRPNDEAVDAICAALGTQTPEDRIGDVFMLLAPHDPILAGKLAFHQLAREPDEPHRGPSVRLAAWHCKMFGRLPNWDSGRLDARAFFSGRSATEVPLDPYFADHLAREAVTNLAGGVLSRETRANLYASLHIERFREFLTRKVLEHLHSELKT